MRCRFKHKTSKARRASTSPFVRQMVISSCVYARLQFYGPAKTSMSPLVSKWVDAYVAAIELDFADRPYLFHVQSDLERCVSSSQWTNIVKVPHSRAQSRTIA